MSCEWDSDSPSPHEQTLKSSTSKIPIEREDRPMQSTSTHLRDHLRLQVAVKRGTLLSRETKMTRFPEAVMHVECSKAGLRECQRSCCHCCCFLSVSVVVVFFSISLRYHNIQNGSRDQDPIGLQRKKWGCATGILGRFVKGRRDWHCHPRQRKVGVEVKRCCNMKHGPRGRVAGWRTLMGEMRSCPSRLC